MSTEKNLHEGHRKRVREEFLNHGYNENTPDHLVLEHMLFYSLAQGDTNPLAHRLVNKFGSLSGVLDAPIEELLKISGVGERTAIMIKLYQEAFRIYNYQKREHNVDFDSADSIGDYIYSRYLGVTNEKFSVLGMNSEGKLLFFKFLFDGDVASVGVSIKEIIKLTLDNRATNIVIAHNHPGGVALPSAQDIAVTKKLVDTLRQVEIILFDHILVSDNDYVSLRLSEDYCHIFL